VLEHQPYRPAAQVCRIGLKFFLRGAQYVDRLGWSGIKLMETAS
jgi:hypothetical protein